LHVLACACMCLHACSSTLSSCVVHQGQLQPAQPCSALLSPAQPCLECWPGPVTPGPGRWRLLATPRLPTSRLPTPACPNLLAPPCPALTPPCAALLMCRFAAPLAFNFMAAVAMPETQGHAAPVSKCLPPPQPGLLVLSPPACRMMQQTLSAVLSNQYTWPCRVCLPRPRTCLQDVTDTVFYAEFGQLMMRQPLVREPCAPAAGKPAPTGGVRRSWRRQLQVAATAAAAGLQACCLDASLPASTACLAACPPCAADWLAVYYLRSCAAGALHAAAGQVWPQPGSTGCTGRGLTPLGLPAC
jgi:hypothetical protein